MTKLPRLNGREVIKARNNGSFRAIRVRGSHHLLRHVDGRTTTVPVPTGPVVATGPQGQRLYTVG